MEKTANCVDTPAAGNINKGAPSSRRWLIVIIAAASAAVLTGISFVMMLRRAPNMHVIFMLVLLLTILPVIFLAIWALGASKKHERLAATLRRCFFACLAIGVAIFVTLQCLIISSARTEDEDADCLIVLGAGLRNGVPSLILRTRLDAAVRYINERGPIPVIVTGGLGSGETITEAEAMSRYLQQRNVDSSLIFKEETSTRTKENISFALDIMEEAGLDTGNIKVAVVSNEFHLYRAKLIAGKEGVEAIGVAAPTPGLYLKALYFFREAFSLTVELLSR